MADSFSNSSGLVVHFLKGTHLLDLQKLVVFTNLTNAVFEGDERMEQGFHETVWQSTVVIKCTEHSSTGIAFVNSSNITFRYITITNCGADMLNNTISVDLSLGNASLWYLSVGYIAIDHASVQNGSGSGLLIIIEGADLSITTSSFAQNCVQDSISNHTAVANVLIVYTDPLNCDPQKYVYNTLITNTNISHLPFHSFTISPFGLAMKIIIIQLSYSVIIVLDSVIAYGNKGLGDIVIGSINNVPNYNLTINNSLSSGSGLGIVAMPDQLTKYHKCFAIANTNSINNIFIANSKFVYMRFSCSIEFLFQGINYPVRIMIESTEISHNVVTQSSLQISSYTYQSQVQIVLQNVTINNNSCSWSQNDFNSNSKQLSAVRAEFVSGLVLNNVSITNNSMTGLLAYRTAVVINGTSVFDNNTGINGGGLAMYGESYLVFKKNSLLNFTNNRAKQKGGAIFVNTQLTNNSSCFYQYFEGTLPWSTKATFFDNNARTAGTVLFGGNRYCLLFNNPVNYIIDYFNVTFDYSAQTGPSVISSEPTDVCFCNDNNTINCSQTQLTMTAYPGEEINISVVTVGQLNGVAPGLLEIKPFGKISAPVEIRKTIAMNCTTIAFIPIDVNYSLTTSDSTGSNSVMLNIERSDCLLGFHVSNKTGVCDCTELTQKASNSLSIKCDAATNTLSRQGDAWIGNISDCVVVHSPCPFDYCKITNTNFSLTDPDPQCALNRTGILCGRCQDGLSLALGSNNCIQCPEFSYLALMIPFAAAGFGLVALLMVLNLTVSIGTINGLIFYASIVKISESTGIFFPNGPIPVLSQFIAWLTLDLGIETCFYPHMTASMPRCGCSLCSLSTYGSS